ncbi:zinc-binding alcohol dehydrogenase family protein [Kaistia geumhonensis]|uniref:Zinc-type alcohol dehydrogenase-like protein n=1 Tax=Kaistia geumhonensis TaxID=410839 RepID=A0ABU0MBV4_9HYPH|nr:zinc-binding alcohol dehydrogenase family protein [Kaistia geumhonensis]MCX5481387.1 zinc-binding alcohol dehydrogenase family protein [Kaistia geumhonensis]MDQ0518452.1 zinc-binding alcohol dehydrogenase family protein [Kaistia geumhonensis]
MRAIAFTKPLPIDDENALVDITLDRPKPGPRDLIVKVEAVSVNPVDFKVRRSADPAGTPRLLGFDAAGTVVEAGGETRLFKVGDPVFYAGSIVRPGTDAEFHAVDERIVGRKPESLDFAGAAALPLTALTAWELLFDRIGVVPGAGDDQRSLLVLGGAGGVGSITIQLARALTGLRVIASASRPETVAFVEELGAHHVVDHSRPLAPQIEALGLKAVDIILAFAGTSGHAGEIAALVAPEGHVGIIEGVDGFGPAEFGQLYQKAVGLQFESMFARSRFGTPAIERQHEILDRVAALVDAGTIRTTLTKTLSPINAANLREAHKLVESGRMIGKLVVAGW